MEKNTRKLCVHEKYLEIKVHLQWWCFEKKFLSYYPHIGKDYQLRQNMYENKNERLIQAKWRLNKTLFSNNHRYQNSFFKKKSNIVNRRQNKLFVKMFHFFPSMKSFFFLSPYLIHIQKNYSFPCKYMNSFSLLCIKFFIIFIFQSIYSIVYP